MRVLLFFSNWYRNRKKGAVANCEAPLVDPIVVDEASGGRAFYSSKPWPMNLFEEVVARGSKDRWYRLIQSPDVKTAQDSIAKKDVTFPVQRLNPDGTWGPVEQLSFCPFRFERESGKLILSHPLYRLEWLEGTSTGYCGIIM
ncbi:MAG: hypothetical protein JWO40_751 [Candidatus Doudnabacteria bacterium]|nr:hypothetical protein [Candidatus Doudnabacteria bacterium]